LDLGRLVASSCRQKIMTALASVGQTHMMDLVRKVNSTYTQVDRNLKILQKEGIVEIKYFGRMRMIKLNRENPKTEVILKALRILTRARTS
jgi:predicted transcriptional regulator